MCKLSKAWNVYQNCVLLSKSQRSISSESARWLRIETYFDDCLIKKITALKIIEFKNYLFSLNLSPQSVRHALSLLQRVIRKSQTLELYNGKIPIFEMPHFDNKRSRFLSQQEARDLLATLQEMSPLWHDITYLSLMTGLRAGEIFNLKPSNYDRNNNLLYIFDCKSNLNRTVPLNSSVCKVLLKYNFQNKEQPFFFAIQKMSNLRRLAEYTLEQ